MNTMAKERPVTNGGVCNIMKSKLVSIIFTASLLSLAEPCFAQGFVNLNFENPILPLMPIGGPLPKCQLMLFPVGQFSQATFIIIL